MQLKSELRQFIVENFLYGQDDNDLKDDVSLLDKGLIDSTGVIELVSFIQKKYGVTVDDEEIIPDNFDSIDKLSVFMTKKMNNGR